MQPKLLELHFAQLQSEWGISRYNSYSDVRKQEYHDNLAKIIAYLKSEDFSVLTPDDIEKRFYVIYFVFKSLEFLNHSTTSTIPFELVNVLELALNDWSNTDEYLIVTSLINGINEFSFDNSLTFFDLVYSEIDVLCSVKFKHRLVQINLPESTSKDYLANVVLYHELGHFVEKKYKISKHIYTELIQAYNKGLSDADKKTVLNYFPYFADAAYLAWLETNYDPYNMFAMHISEYFCDLFASQYIKDCSSIYLEYITLNETDYSATHPSTVVRVFLVNDFLYGKNNYLVNEFKRIVKSVTKVEMEIKLKEFTSDAFEKLVPVEIGDAKELHNLFVYGWKVWLADWNTIEKAAHIDFNLSRTNVYNIINNLIEKSIGNYFIKEEWTKGKHVIV